MAETVFEAEGERFMPTQHARGPWDPRALHGGAPAALLAATFEHMQPGSELNMGLLRFEFLRPIPFAPLSLSTSVLRPGRRVQELAAELRSGDDLICRANALRVLALAEDLPEPAVSAEERERAMPGPEAGTPMRFALEESDADSFAGSAMEMRWIDEPWQLAPARVWMRLRHPLLSGQPLTPLARLAATADFGNGVSAVLPFERYLFINADLTIHLARPPRGEWIGLDARTVLHRGGAGLSESVLHDVHGVVGRAFQALVVQPR